MFVLVAVRGFETEEQFEKHVRTDPQSHQILAAVIFEHSFTHDDEPLPLQVKGIAFSVTPMLCAFEYSVNNPEADLYVRRKTSIAGLAPLVHFLKMLLIYWFRVDSLDRRKNPV